jgi:hypothetical protein
MKHAACARAEQDQVRHPFRVTSGVGNGNCSTLRHAEERQLLELASVGDGLKVIEPKVE